MQMCSSLFLSKNREKVHDKYYVHMSNSLKYIKYISFKQQPIVMFATETGFPYTSFRA